MKRPPKLHDLTVLRATMCLYASPKLLPVVLESCPNLKHLTLVTILAFKTLQVLRLSPGFEFCQIGVFLQELVIDDDPDAGSSTRLSTVLPRCLVSSLESVEMESPVTEIATELKLARYFMKNSTTLQKLVLRLDESSTGVKHKPGVLEQLVKFSKRYSLCQFKVLPVVPTPSPCPGYVHVKSNRF